MTSLILPKLILSVARVGMCFSRLAGYPPSGVSICNDTRQATRVRGKLAKLSFLFRSDDLCKRGSLFFGCTPRAPVGPGISTTRGGETAAAPLAGRVT
jgi:hypothetical protein